MGRRSDRRVSPPCSRVGRILLPDGDILRIGYAGNNGHGYVSIGRALIKKGEFSAGQAGWTQIRRWIEMNPQKTDALLAENPRYIFFREIPGDGPIGAQGVALTPRQVLLWTADTSRSSAALARHGLAGRRQSTVAAAHGGARYGQCDQGTDPGRLLLGLWAGRAGGSRPHEKSRQLLSASAEIDRADVFVNRCLSGARRSF